MNELMEIDWFQVKKLFANHNYRFFERPNSLNIFGIRNESKEADKFDDLIGLAWTQKDADGDLQKCARVFWGTLDSGAYYLQNPMDPGGAAGIVENQYLGVWQLGKFLGKEALIQIAPFKVYRDANRDTILDYNPARTTSGLYGIFEHEHYQNQKIARHVQRSSAGCVVPQDRDDHKYLIDKCIKQIHAGLGNKFSFTVFNQKQAEIILI